MNYIPISLVLLAFLECSIRLGEVRYVHCIYTVSRLFCGAFLEIAAPLAYDHEKAFYLCGIIQ